MKTGPWLSIVLALCPMMVRAEQPGSAAPQSPAWGVDYREQLQDVFDRVVHASRYPLKSSLNMAFFPQPLKGPDGRPIKNPDGSPRMGQIPGQFVGAGALAFGPNLGLNKGNPKPVVAVTEEIFTLAHDRDEVAFVIAHELAHLELDHPAKLDREIARQFDAWYAGLPESFTASAEPKQVAAEFQKARAGALAAFQRPLETAADERGLALAKEAGFKASGGSVMMRHAQDYIWAKGWTPPASADHPPVMQRAKALKESVEQVCLPPDWAK